MSRRYPLEALAQSVLDHAIDHYDDGGWDVVVECWDVAMIVDRWKQDTTDFKVDLPRSPKSAIESFRPLVAVWADRQADARNSAF